MEIKTKQINIELNDKIIKKLKQKKHVEAISRTSIICLYPLAIVSALLHDWTIYWLTTTLIIISLITIKNYKKTLDKLLKEALTLSMGQTTDEHLKNQRRNKR